MQHAKKSPCFLFEEIEPSKYQLRATDAVTPSFPELAKMLYIINSFRLFVVCCFGIKITRTVTSLM